MPKIIVEKKIVRVIRSGSTGPPGPPGLNGPPGLDADLTEHESAADPHVPYYLTDGTKKMDGDVDIDGNDIVNFLESIGTEASASLKRAWSALHSAGLGTGGCIVDTGSNTFKIETGIAALRETAVLGSPFHPVTWDEVTGQTIALGETKFVGIEWNGGDPQPATRPVETWNGSSEIGLGRVHRDAAGVHITNALSLDLNAV